MERLKFVQGYAAGQHAQQQGGSTAARRAANAADLESGGVVGKYLGEYEKSVNPFSGERGRLTLLLLLLSVYVYGGEAGGGVGEECLPFCSGCETGAWPESMKRNKGAW